MATQVVNYQVDEFTVVSFEIEPGPGFRPAGANEIAGKVSDAVGPAVEAAKVVLDKVKDACPEHIEVKFGIKVSGGANWLIAKASAEGSFEVTLSWSSDRRHVGHAAEVHQGVEAPKAAKTIPTPKDLDVAEGVAVAADEPVAADVASGA